MYERIYEEMRKEILNDYHSKMQALDDLWAKLQPANTKPQFQRLSYKLIEETLANMTGEFRSRDVAKELENREDLDAIKTSLIGPYLRRMAKEGKLVVVKHGGGALGTLYRKS